MDESGYRRQAFKWWEFSGEANRLLVMATLPLIDGFFLAYTTTDLWRSTGNAVAFGLTAFSGAGCFIAAMELKGSIWHRLLETIKVYVIVGMIAAVITIFQPVFASFLPDNLNLFTGLFLIGLGLFTSGIDKLKVMAKWIGFDAAIKIMLAASVLNGVFNGVEWKVNLAGDYLPAIITMALSGFCLTFSGVLLGLLVHNKEVNHRPLNIGAAISLVFMGTNVLGAHIQSLVVLSPLLLGCILVVYVTLRKKWSAIKEQIRIAKVKNQKRVLLASKNPEPQRDLLAIGDD